MLHTAEEADTGLGECKYLLETLECEHSGLLRVVVRHNVRLLSVNCLQRGAIQGESAACNRLMLYAELSCVRLGLRLYRGS